MSGINEHYSASSVTTCIAVLVILSIISTTCLNIIISLVLTIFYNSQPLKNRDYCTYKMVDKWVICPPC